MNLLNDTFPMGYHAPKTEIVYKSYDPGKLKHQNSCGPHLGKLVHQLPERMIARWKGIIKEIHFGGPIIPSTIIENLDPENIHLGPQNGPESWKGWVATDIHLHYPLNHLIIEIPKIREPLLFLVARCLT